MVKTEIREQLILENNDQKIFGIIHRPISCEGKLPAVLLCHGLGGNKIGKHRLYVELAEKLASLGIIAMRIDFRGSGDSEGNFVDMTIQSEVDDALKALDYLKNDPMVDSNRIGLFGRSFGGVVAILSASHYEIAKSMALWAPLYSGDPWMDKWKMLKSKVLSSAESNALMHVNGVQPGIAFFDQLFKLKLSDHLEKLSSIPFLHICGEKDEIVSLYHAEKFKEARGKKGESLFFQYPKTDHDFSNTQERYEALEETAQWFLRTL